MMVRRQTIVWLLGVVIAVGGSLPALAQERMRPIYVISDLHMGVGRASGDDCLRRGAAGDWHCLEDSRWPEAMKGFLDKLSSENPDGVDLVFAGDLFDFMQHPTIRRSTTHDPECGYSVEEMKRIVSDVLAGHKSELDSIGRFLASGSNRIFVIPGNHDAALFENEIWGLVAQAVPRGRERFVRVVSETWFSDDGQIGVEHGHQHPYDVNRFPGWPRDVFATRCAEGRRFFRPWGELFMQALYNDAERKLPLIDNLVPDSRGISVYVQYTGQEGTILKDLTRFVTFNVLQTSRYQKTTILEVDRESGRPIELDLDYCRRCVGEDLVLRSPEGKDYSALAGAKGSEDERAFGLALREQVRGLDDGAVKELCERAINAAEGRLAPNPDLRGQPGCSEPLGMAFNMIVDGNGTRLLEERLTLLREQNEKLRFYFFGHTHEARMGTSVVIPKGRYKGREIKAFNSGAFQRLMEADFLEAQKREEGGAAPVDGPAREDSAFRVLTDRNLVDPGTKKESDVAALLRLTHQDMKPCYPVLEVTYDDRKDPRVRLRQWYKTENVSDNGEFLDACDARCSARPAECARRR